ncbi:MAG: cyclic nucleotide-binding protein, partial [Burkholderiales bacterium PBB5]
CDCLNSDQRRRVRDSGDIDYVREGQAMLRPGDAPTHLFVIIKGHVQQWDGDELAATYGPDDCFDGRALVSGKASSRFVAAEEVLAYRLAKSAVNELISANATFGALLFADLSKKLSALSAHERQHELQSLTLARVDQAVVRPATLVDRDTDIVSIARLFSAQRITHVLVRGMAPGDGAASLGVFTTAGLQRAILSGRPLDQLPVGDLASHPLVTVRPTDPLYDALATMIRHRVQRVVVVDQQVDGEVVLGMLEQIDLLSFLSNHSYLITRQIIEAQDLPALRSAAGQITKMIGLLQQGGTKVGLIARLVQELNAKLFERTWQLLAPADLVANACLFVMGSEGRGEQLLKTDQDNGLILRDGYEPPADLQDICDRFSQALSDFGYPECPGGIMVSRPQWRHGAAEFSEMVRRGLLMPSADSLMSLAIFLDAHAVCGDAALLQQVRGEVFALTVDNDLLLARFAAAITAFDGATAGWWNRLLSLEDSPSSLDLKKAGTFPLVHGIRSLALAHQVQAVGTVPRIEALVAVGALPDDLAGALVDSLHFFMGLKLKLGLAALAAGKSADGGIALDRLSSLDRDLLKDTLDVVKRFKTLLRQRFHLDAL